MSPNASRRMYGSVDDPTKPQRPSPERTLGDASADRPSSNSDPSLPLRGGAKRDAGVGMRSFALVVVGMVAVSVMVGLSGAGYRLPKLTRSSEIQGDTSEGQSLIDVGERGVAGSNEHAAVRQPSQREFPKIVSSHAQQESLTPLDFTALNPYHVRDGKPATDYPWLRDVKLIEPFRETSLSVTSPREGFEYRWVVRGQTPGEAEERVEASGTEAVVVCTVLEENLVTLEEVDAATGEVVRRLEEEVMVKYVRREIRTLMDDEREELFDAMHTLWTVRVEGGNGRELYGDAYSDIYAINRLHFKAATPIDCDHFHDGLGFLTNHAMVSNTFEASLQAVNPKLTLPYWDFTIESSTSGGAGLGAPNEALHKSPLFQESWFGTVDPQDDQVKDGRWAYTKIPPMMHNNPGSVQPDVYSRLRAPWNVNDRPYITRGMGKMCNAKVDDSYPWPTCELHYDTVTAYHDFYSWVWYASYSPHGAVHVWIGGVLDCEKTFEYIGSLIGLDLAEELSLYSFAHRKNLYRDGFFTCTGTASVEEAPEDVLASGMCGCHDHDLTQGDDYKEIYDTMIHIDSVIGDFDSDIKRKVVAALCTTPMNDGDHLQASSSIDPSFYVTHPTMDRLWMYTVLTGQMNDYTWPDADVTITEEDGSITFESISLNGETCTGHRGGDVFPFGLLHNDTDGFEITTGVKGARRGNTLANRDLLAAFDPRINSMTYVYDNFKWPHCAEDGFDLDDAWHHTETTTAPERRTRFEDGVKRFPMYDVMKKLRAAEKAADVGGRLD
ncbi:unnamed protein product [Scytosiphon promiscuus]